jgi:ribose 5-phosphate isomerase B
MRIAIGSDHAGFALKTRLACWLEEQAISFFDVGAHCYDAEDDYPDPAAAVGRAVGRGEADLGVMVCGTGVGSAIALNKLDGIRAVVGSDTYSARMSRRHNDANVLCLGERVVGEGLAQEIVQAWLKESFSGEARHQRRLDKVAALEREGGEAA